MLTPWRQSVAFAAEHASHVEAQLRWIFECSRIGRGLRHGAELRRRCELDQPESEPNTYGVVCLNFDADGGELGVGSGQGDVGVGDDWAGGDMGPMSLLSVRVHMLLDIIM